MENKNLSTFLKELDKATSKIKSFVNSIVDPDSFVETDAFLTGKSFDSALDAQGEGVVTGYATISGNPVHLFAQNAEVMKGSMSLAQSQKILKAMERAVKAGVPFVSIIDSCGARVGEGATIMESYSQLISYSEEVLSGEVPHIAIVKGVAVGMMATYVAGADFVFMADDAFMSVNSPMYLGSKTDAVPVDFKKMIGFNNYKANSDLAQFNFKDEKELNQKLNLLLSTILPADEEESDDDPNRIDPKLDKPMAAVDRIKSICDKNSVIDYCADYSEDVKCAIAKINGISVGVLATQGEYLTEAGLDKAASFIDKLTSYDLPLVTLVDTLGVNPTLEQELNGFAKKTSNLMRTIANSSISKIGIAVGNAVGFGYSALMSKNIGFDYTLACEHAVISPIASVTAVNSILADQLKVKGDVEKLRVKVEKEYNEIQANPLVAAKDGFLDNVIEAKNIRPYVASALLMLLGI